MNALQQIDTRYKLLKYVLFSVLLGHYIFQANVVSVQTARNTVYAWDYLLTRNPVAKNEFYQLLLLTLVFGGVVIGFYKDDRFLIPSLITLSVFSLGFPLHFHTWFLFPVEIALVIYCITAKGGTSTTTT